MTASECLLVDVTSVESARRLVEELRGLRAEIVPGEGDHCVVAIELDRQDGGWLNRVLAGLQTWLDGSALDVCRVQHDGRSYVLERAAP
jgi:hypothetical protein